MIDRRERAVQPEDALNVEVPDAKLLAADLAEEADSLLRLAHQARVESATLAEFRDALLPELLSGRLRIPPGRLAFDAPVPALTGSP